jgi:hypothetical protein
MRSLAGLNCWRSNRDARGLMRLSIWDENGRGSSLVLVHRLMKQRIASWKLTPLLPLRWLGMPRPAANVRERSRGPTGFDHQALLASLQQDARL